MPNSSGNVFNVSGLPGSEMNIFFFAWDEWMHGPRWHGAAETKELSSDSPDGKDAGELGEARAVPVPPTVGSCLEGGEKIPWGKKILQNWCFFCKATWNGCYNPKFGDVGVSAGLFAGERWWKLLPLHLPHLLWLGVVLGTNFST